MGKSVIKIVVFIFLQLTAFVGKSQFDKYLDYDTLSPYFVRVGDCFQENSRTKDEPSKLLIVDVNYDNTKNVVVSGVGFIRRKVKLNQCVFWRTRFSLELLINDQWLKWRECNEEYDGGFPGLDYSSKEIKYKRRTKFNYLLNLGSINSGTEELQARLCFQVQDGEYMYSEPFTVKISQDHIKWVIKRNNK